MVTATTDQPVWADYFHIFPNPVDFAAPTSWQYWPLFSFVFDNATTTKDILVRHKKPPLHIYPLRNFKDLLMMSNVDDTVPITVFWWRRAPPSRSHDTLLNWDWDHLPPPQPIYSANADASGSGVSQHEPDSYFGTPLAPNRAASTHRVASAASPGAIRSSGPNST
ncbi:hypothetical protein K438DRAFT_2023471 [Mycena galopus ATCC 62051]|nr:hypothetical protein K438DRAFT_2023471 [Mycena galopus ATCC 62051]